MLAFPPRLVFPFLKAIVRYFNLIRKKKHLKLVKNACYLTEKAAFVLEILKFLPTVDDVIMCLNWNLKTEFV